VWLLYCSSSCFPIVEFRYEESETFASTRQTVAHRRLSLHSRKRSDFLSLQVKSTAWELIAPGSVFSFGWLRKGRNCVERKTRKKKTLEPSHVVHVRSLLPILLRSNSRIHDCNAKSKESVRAQLYTLAVGTVEDLMRSMRFSRALHWRFLRWGERRKQRVVEEW